MIRDSIIQGLEEAFGRGVEEEVFSEAPLPPLMLDTPKEEKFGDFSSNLAMVLAKRLRRQPMMLAVELVSRLRIPKEIVQEVKVEPPGFINFFVAPIAYRELLKTVIRQGDDYGRSDYGGGRRIQVEFVSANPVGPMHVGHGRWAALGDTLSRLLAFTGFQVQKEFYINDYGTQMELFGKSVYARYMELHGGSYPFPEEGYHGEYIREIARALSNQEGRRFLDMPEEEGIAVIRERAYTMMLDQIKRTLEKCAVSFDVWFSERTLHNSGYVKETLDLLRTRDQVYEKDGAVWFKSSALGDDKDRVLYKEDGNPTYFIADIAYHRHKLERGFDKIIDIWGADHFGHVQRMKGALEALGYSPDVFEALLGQLVNLRRGEVPVRMSKRTGEMVTFEELIDEVGKDAVRFFFLMRSANSALDFDIELAKSQSNENPVYYVQYAHARCCSLEKMAAQQGLPVIPLDETRFDLLGEKEEIALMKILEQFPVLLVDSAAKREPHRLTYFAQEFAAAFHFYYNRHRILTDDVDLSSARLWLARAVRQVVKNLCFLLGISAPENM
jgi:arginyl-tRNA synthetase